MAVVASLAGLGAYAGFVSQCRSKGECNTIHSYALAVPVSKSEGRQEENRVSDIGKLD